MKKKLKNIGKKLMKKNNLNSIRKEILDVSKKYILKNGWNKNLFKSISKNTKYKYEEILSLFPDGHLSLLNFYLDQINIKMTKDAKSLNLSQMKTHTKIKEIILLRLKICKNEKEIIKRTFFTLLLPKHYQTSLNSLYKTTDQIWFIAGDNSTDFNFYSKRIILAKVYSSTLLHWINNDNFENTIKYLDNQLLKTSKISEYKKIAKNISTSFPKFFNILKNI